MAEDLIKASSEMGLSINFSKTKVMSNISALGEVKINEEKIEQVTEYRYLGQVISFENKMEKEIKVRRANAWKAFWAQKYLLKSKLGLKTKIRIFQSTVLPVLMYGAQTWALTAKQLKKLQVTQNSMLRSILVVRLSDKINLTEIYEKTNTKKVRVTARVQKFKYAGHIARDRKDKWNVILTSWMPH